MFFILCSIILFCIIIYLMPKRMTLMEMYATAWFALTFVLIVDTYFSTKFNLYGYFFEGLTDWRTPILLFGVYPTYNAIFLNFFPQAKWHQLLYILMHSIILVGYEWATIHAGAFHYNHWKLGYSAILYPFILLILYGNLKVIRVLKKRS